MQKADVARVMAALAQAQARWTADSLGGGGTEVLRRSANVESNSAESNSTDSFDADDELAVLEAMMAL